MDRLIHMFDPKERTYRQVIRLAAGLGLILLLQAQAPIAVAGTDAAASARVERMVALLEKRQGDSFWSLVSRIEELGKPAIPALKARLSADCLLYTSPSPRDS